MGRSPGCAGSARRGGSRAACPRGYRRGHWASSARYRTGYPHWSATVRPRWPLPSLVPVWGLGLPWAVSFLIVQEFPFCGWPEVPVTQGEYRKNKVTFHAIPPAAPLVPASGVGPLACPGTRLARAWPAVPHAHGVVRPRTRQRFLGGHGLGQWGVDLPRVSAASPASRTDSAPCQFFLPRFF